MRVPDPVVRVGAAVGRAVSSVEPDARWLWGPDATGWRRLRPLLLPAERLLGRWVHLSREIRDSEYAGRVDGSLADAEETLWAAGYRRNPFSALKTRDGDPEAGSWARRDGERQHHVMLFEAEDGVDVYAHEEFSSIAPSVAVAHYEATDQREDLGVALARDRLPVGPTATRDVPDGRLVDDHLVTAGREEAVDRRRDRAGGNDPDRSV